MGMCTGDNILTAISVGRECGLLPPSPEVVSKIRRESVAIKDVLVYDNLFPQEEGYVNMNDEILPSGSFGLNLKRQSMKTRQQSFMSSSSSDTSYPTVNPSPSPSNLLNSLGILEEKIEGLGSGSNFLLFVPFLLNGEYQWRSLDVPIIKLNSDYEIEIEATEDLSHILGSNTFHFSAQFMRNLKLQQLHLLKTRQLLKDVQYCFAMDGDCFEHILENQPVHLHEMFLSKCKIFARMSPDQKQDLVERLQKFDNTVGFVGDGANDCGALKASDVGLSLSEAEASIAAPFTSKNFEIDCVISLMREGRAALVTSFSCFKYMAMYSLIQFLSVTMLYHVGSNLGDYQFLYVDLILILPLAITMAHSGPYKHLHPKKPTANLLSGKVLSSLFGQILVQLCFLIIVFVLVQHQKFYTPPDTDVESERFKCYENTVLFIVSSFQYIILAYVYSIGPPYRAPLSRNTHFIITFLILVICTTILAMGIIPSITTFMELEYTPFLFKLLLLLLGGCNFLASLVGERNLFPFLSKKTRELLYDSH
eukprot:NODE_14_length_51535_cov_1.125049.p6 type:complete len:536 gc:universal NODE_14_length_51535_cov_1.125049:19802-18195(-)